MTKLEGDELHVLKAIEARLVAGKKQYGQLDLRCDKRDWSKELLDELLDACVYLVCERIRSRREKLSVWWFVRTNLGVALPNTLRNSKAEAMALRSELADMLCASPGIGG